MTNPALNWLRDVALEIEKRHKLDIPLRAYHILDIADHADLEVPGISESDNLENDATRDKALRGIGKRLAACFGPSSEEVTIDHMVIERRITVDEASRDTKEYVFRVAEPAKFPGFPHSPAFPHDPPTFYTPSSIEPSTNGNHSKCLEPRGVCGTMRECGKQPDTIESNSSSAGSDAWEWGEV